MRVLALTLYPGEFSSRTRVNFLVPFLERDGIKVDVHAPVSRLVFEECYQGTHRQWLHYHLHELIGRLRQIIQSSQYDLVWIQKGLSLFPWRGLWNLRGFFNGRIVFDLDDALVHLTPVGMPIWARPFADHNQVRKIHRDADLVLCATPALTEESRKLGKVAHLFPTTIPLSHYPYRMYKEDLSPTLVWIGTASDVHHIEPLAPVLSRLSRNFPGLKLLILTDRPQAISVEDFGGCRIELLSWEREQECRQLRRGWVGILPMPEDPWTQHRNGYKILQYYACGLPVVASPVGGNGDLIQEGETGFFAVGEQEWYRALLGLLSDHKMSDSIGLTGRQFVEDCFASNLWAHKLAGWFRELGPRERPVEKIF